MKYVDTSKLLGIPYEKGAYRLEEGGGLDCWGLTLEVYALIGGRLGEFARRFWAGYDSVAESELWERVPDFFEQVDAPSKVGDLLLMKGTGNREHILVYLTPSHIMHCTERMGPHVLRWRNIHDRVHTVMRLKGGEYR